VATTTPPATFRTTSSTRSGSVNSLVTREATPLTPLPAGERAG
jgi:hypothetical protein